MWYEKFIHTKKMFWMCQGSKYMYYIIINYIKLQLPSKCTIPLKKVYYTCGRNFCQIGKKSRKLQKFLLAKFSAKTFIRQCKCHSSIGFQCCFDVMTLTLNMQNIEITKANVMNCFI